MKLLLSALIVAVTTAFGKVVANAIGKRAEFYKGYLDFLSELLFAVRLSKETVGNVKDRFVAVFEKKKYLDEKSAEEVDFFLENVGKRDKMAEEIRILAEKERVEKQVGANIAKSGEKRKSAVIVGMLIGIIVVLIII